MAISVSVRSQELARFLKRAETSLGDKQKLLNNIADLELQETRLRFINQVNPSFTPWKQTQRQKKDPSAKILRRTSNLFNSITKKVVGDAAYIGTNVSYAAFHNEGTKFIPKRQFIGANQQTILNIDKAIKNMIEKDIK